MKNFKPKKIWTTTCVLSKKWPFSIYFIKRRQQMQWPVYVHTVASCKTTAQPIGCVIWSNCYKSTLIIIKVSTALPYLPTKNSDSSTSFWRIKRARMTEMTQKWIRYMHTTAKIPSSMQEVCHILIWTKLWPKLQWVSCSSVVERPTGVRNFIGLTPVGRTQKFFSE